MPGIFAPATERPLIAANPAAVSTQEVDEGPTRPISYGQAYTIYTNAAALHQNGDGSEAPGRHLAAGHHLPHPIIHQLRSSFVGLLPTRADPAGRKSPDEPPGFLRPPRRLPHLPALLPTSPDNLASQGPHLVLLNEAVGSHAFYCLPLRRRLRLRLPHARLTAYESDITRFYSLGCRVAVEDRTYNPSRRELCIVHLLTGETSRFPELPKHFYRVLLSDDLVLACNPYDRVFQYCRLGDDQWRVASSREVHRFEDLIFVKDTLYALVNPSYRLAIVELSDNNSLELSFLGEELDEQIVQRNSLFFLAQCRGELLLISCVGRYQRMYHAFRWQIEERNWVRTTSFGGCTLFFHDHCFVGCLGPDYPGIQRDCMYFTSDAYGEWSRYSLSNGSFHEFADCGVRGAVDKAAMIWVFPSMC